jgi:hypothetical protein
MHRTIESQQYEIAPHGLVTNEGLKRIHDELDGRGYLPPFPNSRSLRDTELGVKIEFLVTGNYPGDGKPKPVAFPDPSTIAVELDDRKYIPLTTLMELKFASGMTNPHRFERSGRRPGTDQGVRLAHGLCGTA